MSPAGKPDRAQRATPADRAFARFVAGAKTKNQQLRALEAPKRGCARPPGIATPEFKEVTGGAVVAFRVPVAPHAGTGEVTRLFAALADQSHGRRALQATLVLRHEDHFRAAYLTPRGRTTSS